MVLFQVLSGSALGVLVVTFANGLRRVPLTRSESLFCFFVVLDGSRGFSAQILGSTSLER